VAGSVIIYQKKKLETMRATAQSIFYMMKSQELQIARLEEVVLMRADPKQVAELQAKKDRFKGMEKEYNSFVKELGIYGKLSEEDRIIMRMARLFGECEVAMPPGFADEVKRYIGLWKSTNRLQTALDRAQQKGYTPLILRILNDNNLPPQYFYLALQESNFNEQAVGPQTRYGYAKGMWQFITQTADRYGLRVGPLYDQGVYDPQDERFNFVTSTVAAMKYIRELSTTYGQASGLLVLASYNWGDGNVREIINRMPDNPRERNFWRLLANRNVPKETYDYVFSIFSAAVICENPRLFGFDCTCPSPASPIPAS
jgi:membrane-bound lytic murein transglycosylase D